MVKIDEGWVSESWQVRKPAVSTTGGLVASQHYQASAVGARVLDAGGNAVDAAIATGIAIGTVEPWMSGLGGGGYMQVMMSGAAKPTVVDFTMISPCRLDPSHYPMTGNEKSEIFTWPEVVGDRNMQGYTSMMVPGFVAGMALALETFGTRTWPETLAPAIKMAEDSMPVDWYATMRIASNARALSQDPHAAKAFLPDGFVPGTEVVGPLPRIQLGNLSQTLRRLAEAGPRDFYEGEIAQSISADMERGGGWIRGDDLAGYTARLVDPLNSTYRDATVHYSPTLTAGPTLHDVFARLTNSLSPSTDTPDVLTYVAYADALFDAYSHRLKKLGADASSRDDPGCTTHITVVDKDGNMVSLTQTLLSVFGSKTMLPGTGILMNNGVLWFDPRPGGPNSIGAAKQPLTNMCPTIIVRKDGSRMALGASGGRRIMPAVMQLISFAVDFEMDLDTAIHTARIDVSGGDTVLADANLDVSIIKALLAHHPTVAATHAVFPTHYACPNAVMWNPSDGIKNGAAFVMSPWAEVAISSGG
jgi:gamma-glutamyltranspeptidase/glutathione hydrolase